MKILMMFSCFFFFFLSSKQLNQSQPIIKTGRPIVNTANLAANTVQQHQVNSFDTDLKFNYGHCYVDAYNKIEIISIEKI